MTALDSTSYGSAPAAGADGSPSRAGRLIAVEGIDASGKTSLAEGVVAALHRRGRPALLVSRASAPDLAGGYPGEHLRGLRRLIWEYDADARTSALGFEHWAHLIAAWFAAVDEVVVRPAVAAGHDVVADSWWPKFAARFATQVGPARASEVFRGVADADDVLWLDVPPEVCAARRSTVRPTEAGEWRGMPAGVDGFVAYQAQVRAQYAAMAAARGWTVLPPAEPDALLGMVDDVVDRLVARGENR